MNQRNGLSRSPRTSSPGGRLAGTEGRSPSPSDARVSIDIAYQRYEYEKQAFVRFNPNASPRQYEQAMQAIAKRYGI